MLLKLVGVTFATDRNPELKQLRPSGSVSFEAEPDNEHDTNAVKVMYKDQHIGYVPKSDVAQTAALEAGTAKIVDYAYWDSDIKWNENHIGQFQSMTFEIGEIEMDNGRILGGRYLRCTKFLKYFDPYGGGDGLLRWAFSQGTTFDEYEEALNECAENGTIMHEAIEKYFDVDRFRETHLDNLPAGWDNFCEKYEPDWVYGEERFYDNNLMVTGQPDFVGYINWKGKRIRAVVDWKSSKKPSMKHKIQASIYSMNCSIDEQPIEGALIVAFGADTKQGYSIGYVDREQIESNYLAMEHIKKAMECVGVYVDEYY